MNGAATAAAPRPAFQSSVFDSQSTFRAVLDAMARPGLLQTIPAILTPPAPLDSATVAVGLTLFDFETPVWLGGSLRESEAAEFLRFHTGCPMVAEPRAATFALFLTPHDTIDLSALAFGSDEYPDRSTTAIIQSPALGDAGGVGLRGPGISGTRRLDVVDLPGPFWRARKELETLFPRGIDLIFASGRNVAAIPRSTRLEV
jgi:alpha-D-ribose 1-methylphosphonate 5-triphosphate synthase subunit PhnH